MRVLAYGTLQFPEVMEAVTGARFLSEPAVLHGYQRLRVQGRAYPGIVVASGRHTPGQLYADVGSHAVALIDRFEGALYERDRVMVTTADGARVGADAYVVPPHRRHVLGVESWDRDAFAAEHLAAFIQSCQEFYRRAGRR